MAESVKYDPNLFLKALEKKSNNRPIPACPFCGGRDYSTTENVTTLLLNNEIGGINLGPTIPAGILVCNKCGHIDLFALGALGLLNKKDGQNDANTAEKE